MNAAVNAKTKTTENADNDVPEFRGTPLMRTTKMDKVTRLLPIISERIKSGNVPNLLQFNDFRRKYPGMDGRISETVKSIQFIVL
jgi:hypothetical protein